VVVNRFPKTQRRWLAHRQTGTAFVGYYGSPETLRGAPLASRPPLILSAYRSGSAGAYRLPAASASPARTAGVCYSGDGSAMYSIQSLNKLPTPS